MDSLQGSIVNTSNTNINWDQSITHITIRLQKWDVSLISEWSKHHMLCLQIDCYQHDKKKCLFIWQTIQISKSKFIKWSINATQATWSINKRINNYLFYNLQRLSINIKYKMNKTRLLLENPQVVSIKSPAQKEMEKN